MPCWPRRMNIVNIDLAAEDLRRRLREGKIYPRPSASDLPWRIFSPPRTSSTCASWALRELASQTGFQASRGSAAKHRQNCRERHDRFSGLSPRASGQRTAAEESHPD